MNYIVLIAISIFINTCFNVNKDCLKKHTSEIFWKCIGENTRGLEEWRKDHLFYFQANRTKDGYEIIYSKGIMDKGIKRIIEDSLNCTDSKVKIRNNIKLIFVHRHNWKILSAEESKEIVENFKKTYNIATNICDYSIISSYKL